MSRTQSAHIGIIGAGIGGLTLALALQRTGHRFTILEQAPELREVGAGLGLWCNATRLLDRLGVGDDIRALAVPVARGQFTSHDGRVLMDIDMRHLQGDIPGSSYIMHRADLHGALAKHVDPASIRLNARCDKIRVADSSVILHHAGGEEVFDAIVGADGLNSVVRAALHGDRPPRYAGETLWRGVAPMAYRDWQMVREISGPGRRVGICPLGPERIYWWATEQLPANTVIPTAERKAHVSKLFRDWAFELPALLEATPADGFLQNDAVDRLPLRPWGRGPVTLLGDAAHPTTPNLGQGACMAIEDAWVLAQQLVAHDDIGSAFRAYEAARYDRVEWMVRTSYQHGKLGQWKRPWAMSLRERMLRATPMSFMRRLWHKQLGYEPGPLQNDSKVIPA